MRPLNTHIVDAITEQHVMELELAVARLYDPLSPRERDAVWLVSIAQSAALRHTEALNKAGTCN